jgi:hypothetical protein
VLGVVGFDRPPPTPSSTGWTVCFEELLDVSLGSTVVVGDELVDGGISLEPLPASALACDAAVAAAAALFLHVQMNIMLMKFTFTMHIDNYSHGMISICLNILVSWGRHCFMVHRQQHYGETYCHCLPKDGGIRFLQNIGSCLHLIRGVNWKTGMCWSEDVLRFSCLVKT